MAVIGNVKAKLFAQYGDGPLSEIGTMQIPIAAQMVPVTVESRPPVKGHPFYQSPSDTGCGLCGLDPEDHATLITDVPPTRTHAAWCRRTGCNCGAVPLSQG